MIVSQAKLCANLISALLIIWCVFEIVINYQNPEGVLLRISLITCLGIMTIWLGRLLTSITQSFKDINHHVNVYKEQIIGLRHDIRSPVSGMHKIARIVHDKVDDNELKRLMSLIINSSQQLMSRVIEE